MKHASPSPPRTRQLLSPTKRRLMTEGPRIQVIDRVPGQSGAIGHPLQPPQIG
jgi:hypothetical protein